MLENTLIDLESIAADVISPSIDLTRGQLAGKRLIAAQQHFGGEIRPCDGCSHRDENLLCDEEGGLNIIDVNPLHPDSRDRKTIATCPLQSGVEVNLVINNG